MRLKFLIGDGHRMVDVVDYTFTPGPPSSVSFEKKERHAGSVIATTERIVINSDVFVTNDRGDTIDRLIPKKEGK